MSRNLFIFDCFGVIMSDVSAIVMDKYLNDEQKAYMRKNVYRKVDVGQISMEDMFCELSALCGVSVPQIKQDWLNSEFVLTDTIEVIRQLKAQGHCIALLSNAAVGYVGYLFDKYGLHKYFDREFVSSKYGCAKPDYEYYKLCVDSFDEQFDATYFTDDNKDFLVGVERLGITPVLFCGADDFARRVGLKTAS